MIKQAALSCAEEHFDDEEKQELPIHTAVMAWHKPPSQEGEYNRACVLRSADVPRGELGI